MCIYLMWMLVEEGFYQISRLDHDYMHWVPRQPASSVIDGLRFGERESPQMEPLLIRALVDAFGFLNFIG